VPGAENPTTMIRSGTFRKALLPTQGGAISLLSLYDRLSEGHPGPHAYRLARLNAGGTGCGWDEFAASRSRPGSLVGGLGGNGLKTYRPIGAADDDPKATGGERPLGIPTMP